MNLASIHTLNEITQNNIITGNLKIADFGLATLYRHKGVVRRLNTICGTLVYVAPEVQFGDYDGARVDVWSCGIILFVLLCGSKYIIQVY